MRLVAACSVVLVAAVGCSVDETRTAERRVCDDIGEVTAAFARGDLAEAASRTRSIRPSDTEAMEDDEIREAAVMVMTFGPDLAGSGDRALLGLEAVGRLDDLCIAKGLTG